MPTACRLSQTLGIAGMATYPMTKLKAAEHQLRTACLLYLRDGDMVSVLTLAGAAEEICGNTLRREGKKNILGIAHDEGVQRGLNFSQQELYAVASELRNALKHAKSAEEDNFVFQEEAAVLMLLRATVNFQLCTGSLPQEAEAFVSHLRESGVFSTSDA